MTPKILSRDDTLMTGEARSLLQAYFTQAHSDRARKDVPYELVINFCAERMYILSDESTTTEKGILRKREAIVVFRHLSKPLTTIRFKATLNFVETEGLLLDLQASSSNFSRNVTSDELPMPADIVEKEVQELYRLGWRVTTTIYGESSDVLHISTPGDLEFDANYKWDAPGIFPVYELSVSLPPNRQLPAPLSVETIEHQAYAVQLLKGVEKLCTTSGK